MFGIFAWIVESKVGRTVAAVFGVVAAVGLVVLKAFSSGKKAEKAEQDAATLENLRTRGVSDDKIHSLSGYQRRASLGDWVSDDDK